MILNGLLLGDPEEREADLKAILHSYRFQALPYRNNIADRGPQDNQLSGLHHNHRWRMFKERWSRIICCPKQVIFENDLMAVISRIAKGTI